MTTNNHTFITKEKLNKLFRNGLNRICNFDRFKEQECISLAFVLPIEMPLPVVKFMDKWVDAIESKLERTEKHSEEYADWLSIRVFTYDEFRRVMETTFNETKFDRVRVYSFLYLDDSLAVEAFKIKYSNEEENIRSRYLRALADVTSVEFPELNDFLCNQKITLRYPVSAFIKHAYCLAQTSSGKSEFIKHIFHELLQLNSSKSLVLLEPHKDLSIEVLELRALWKKGVKNVIYLDPDITHTAAIKTNASYGDEFTFSINPFDNEEIGKKSITFMVEQLSKSFFGIINSEETFQMEAIIEACVETLLLRPNSDILDLKRFMDNNQNQDLIQFAIENLTGERLNLMKHRFESDPKIQQTKSSIYYRLQSILGKSDLVNCLTGKRTVDIQKFINEGRTIICNFSKAKLGPVGAPMLGKLMMALLSGYATLRQNQRKSERMETFVFMDEFQNYVNPGSTEEMFAEQRKYKTYFFVSNQQMGQSMSSETKRIIAGNTALKFMGDNESESIEWFTKQFKKLPEDATFNLPQFCFYFYDKFNKDLGSFILRSPSYLVKPSSTYYLNKVEMKKAFNYLIFESGLYKKIPAVHSNSNTVNALKGNTDILGHNFTS